MTMHDAYPSRVGGRARVLPRKDPVVHAPPSGREYGPLTTGQLEAFDRRGYLCFERLVEPELLRRVVAEADRLLDAARTSRRPEVVREPSTDEVRSIFAIHEHDTVFRDLARHTMLAGVAEQVLGGPVYVHQSRINFKPAFRGEPFQWHSDFETWHVEDGLPRMRALSVSLNLTENRVENGPLMVMPGSHHQYVSCPGTTPTGNFAGSLRRQVAGVPPESVLTEAAARHGIESPVGPVGSATVFDCNLLHGSAGNITPWPRTNVFIVFNSVENRPRSPFSGQSHRPPHIASRDHSPLSPRR